MAYITYATVKDLQRHFTFSSLQKLSKKETTGQKVNDIDIPADETLQLFADLSDSQKQELLEDLLKSACTKINRALRPRYGSDYAIPFTFDSGTEDDTTETLKRWNVGFAAQELMSRPGSKLEQGQRTFLMLHYEECVKELERVANNVDDLDMSNADAATAEDDDPTTTSYGKDYGNAFAETIRTNDNGLML